MARHTGGPMFQADRRGVLVLRAELRGWAMDAPDLWDPAPLVERQFAAGSPFAALDRA